MFDEVHVDKDLLDGRIEKIVAINILKALNTMEAWVSLLAAFGQLYEPSSK